jgi:hypothetical protein
MRERPRGLRALVGPHRGVGLPYALDHPLVLAEILRQMGYSGSVYKMGIWLSALSRGKVRWAVLMAPV